MKYFFVSKTVKNKQKETACDSLIELKIAVKAWIHGRLVNSTNYGSGVIIHFYFSSYLFLLTPCLVSKFSFHLNFYYLLLQKIFSKDKKRRD